MPKLASAVASTPHSGIRAMGTLARELSDVIHLEAGDPDFLTPDHIVEAAATAARTGFTKYTAGAGFASLRELIADKVSRRNGFACHPEQVVVTTGACGGLFTTFLTLLDEGDEVLIPDPGWSNYPAMTHVLRCAHRRYPLDAVRDFAVDVDELARSVGPRTKAVVLNSPGNPVGNVLERDTLAAILKIAREADLWIVSDECYDEMIFEDEHVSAASLGCEDRIITAFSLSKTYAMTGCRLG